MLRCRGQSLALRRLGEALGPTTRWDLEQRGALLAAAGRRRTRSSGGAALSGGIPDGVHGSKVPAAYAATGAFAHADDNKVAGSASSELRAWQAAMIELARRHSAKQAIGHDSKDPNKVSKHTAEQIPEALEAWRKVINLDNSSSTGGSNSLWFRGAAKCYASLLGGVWPKMANHFLVDLIRACDGGARGAAAGVGPWASPGWDVTRIQAAAGSTSASAATTTAAAAAAALPRSSSMSAPSSISQARVSAAGPGVESPLPDCRLDWRRALEVMKEAHLAGVEVRPDLMALVLSKVPVGNSRKISRLVSNKGSRAFGLQASTPDMLAVAAVAHWREGVVTGAARHLDEMFARIKKMNKEMVASPSPLVQNWLAADRQRIRDAAAAAAAVEAPPSHPPERQWPWRLVAVDIYGRANLWAAAAEAFDAFIGEMGFPPSRNGRRRRRRRRSVEGTAEIPEKEEEEEEEAQVSARIAKPTRLPLPEEFGGGSGGGGGKKKTGELSSPLPLQAWSSFHPSAIAHAITAYLKLGRVEEAADVLSFLKASVRAGGATPAAGGLNPGYVGGSEEGGECGGRAGSNPSLSGALTIDPGWMEGTVRGFTRAGKWDMALEVLSTDIFAWFSTETGGDRRSGGGGGAGLAAASESLEAFLEAKLEAKKPASGQVAGSKACLELLKVAAGAQRGVLGNGDAAIATAAAAAPTAAEEENDRPAASAVAVPAAASRGREQGWQREETTPSATAATAAALSPVARETHGSDRVQGKRCDTPEPGGGDARVGKAEGGGSGSSEPVVDRHRQDALVYTEAIRWLLPGGRLAPDRTDGDGKTPEAGGDIPAHLLPAIELFSDGCRSMLQSGCRSTSQEAVLQTICKVWGGGGAAVAAEDAGDTTKERRRSAALALYEAGVESKALPADAHWVSKSAGVLNLDCVDYQMHHGMPLAALNLVLSDMRRKYAYEETVKRHVHPPHGDLVMIASVKGSWRALDNLKGMLWLLGSCRFDGPLDGDLELLGQPGERRHPPADNAATRERDDGNQAGRRRQLELLREAQESMRSPGRGLVVCLSRRTLQGWLLREGRASSRANVGGGGGGGVRLWKPSWVEDGIDVVPPVLPGLLTARDDGTDVIASGAGSGEISGSAPVDAQEVMRDSLYQGVA
ncbi:unnamed protein product [Ectocarpus sp. 4 AP-2014]